MLCRIGSGMSDIDPELERLLLAEESAHARFLRLQGFGDPEVVQVAEKLWQEAAAALRERRGQAKTGDRCRS
jgi:hypothetical protein